MPAIITADALMEEAQGLKTQALAILDNPESGAEEFERAEKLFDAAEEKASKSGKLKDLRKRADDMGDVYRDEKLHGDRDLDKPNDKPRQWKHFGEFLVAVKKAGKGGNFVDERLKYYDGAGDMSALEQKDLAETAGVTGGYLVPTELRPQVLAHVEDESVVRPRANVIPMRHRQIEMPALKQSGTVAGQAHWFGGMHVYWQAEANQKQETQPDFRTLVLTAHEMAAVTHVSNALLADSAVSLAAFMTGPMGFARVVAWTEDYAFLRGNGVGKPMGVIDAPATIVVNRATINQINYIDLINMIDNFLPSGRGMWVANTKVRGKLLQLAGPTATNYGGMFLWGSPKDGIPATFFGIPIIFTEKVPSIGTKGDIGLYDFSHYYIGDRENTTIESTDQERWLRNQTSWRVTHRVDGQPWLDAPFTLENGTDKLSPFVVLGDPA